MEALDLRWRKSSRSDNGGNCVEVGQSAGSVRVRDTKNSGAAVELRFSADTWRRFAEQVKATR
jgi:hypothetical protein